MPLYILTCCVLVSFWHHIPVIGMYWPLDFGILAVIIISFSQNHSIILVMILDPFPPQHLMCFNKEKRFQLAKEECLSGLFFWLKLKESLMDSKSFWNNLFLTFWKERTWYRMLWYQNVAQAAAADPSYRVGWSSSLKAPKERGHMENYPQPQQSSATRPLWNTSNPARFPILPRASIVGCWFVLALFFFFDTKIKRHLVLLFPDKKLEPNLIFIFPYLGIALGHLK